MFAKQHITDNKINDLKDELSHLIERAVSQARTLESEAREETLREFILKRMRITKRKKRKITADDIVVEAINSGLNLDGVLHEFYKMKEDGLIDYEGERIETGSVEIILK